MARRYSYQDRGRPPQLRGRARVLSGISPVDGYEPSALSPRLGAQRLAATVDRRLFSFQEESLSSLVDTSILRNPIGIPPSRQMPLAASRFKNLGAGGTPPFFAQCRREQVAPRGAQPRPPAGVGCSRGF